MSDTVQLKRGATLTLPAPVGAIRAILYGAGTRLVAEVQAQTATWQATDTADLPVGTYAVEWEVVADGVTTLPDGPTVAVRASAKADDLDTSPTTYWWQVLLAARKTLLTAAGSADLSFSVGDSSFSFESRADLVKFMGRVERRVKGRKHWRDVLTRPAELQTRLGVRLRRVERA